MKFKPFNGNFGGDDSGILSEKKGMRGKRMKPRLEMGVGWALVVGVEGKMGRELLGMEGEWVWVEAKEEVDLVTDEGSLVGEV